MLLFKRFKGLLGVVTDISRFSLTDRFSKILGLWNFLPTPSRAILCSFLPTKDFPLKITSPFVGQQKVK